MGFKTAEPATRSPTQPRGQLDFTRTETATRAPSQPRQTRLAPGGDPVRLASTLEMAFALGSEQSVSLTYTPAGVYTQTNVLTMEGALTRSAIAVKEATLTEEAVLASSLTTVAGQTITPSVLIDGRTTAVSTVHQTTADATPAAGALLVLAIVTDGGGPVKTVSGFGSTWVRFAISPAAGAQTLELWRTQSSTPTAGVLTFNMTDVQVQTPYSVMAFTGASTASTEGSAAIVQVASAVVGALGATVSLAPAANARNVMVGVLRTGPFNVMESSVINVGPGFSILSSLNEVSGGRCLYTEWGASTSTAVSWSWTTALSAANQSSARTFAFEVG